MLNPADFKLALQSIDSLGSTPAVLVKVIKLANDPNSDLNSIGGLLRNDGPLTADIIRISNSPFYAPLTPHTNLNSALSLLGLGEVVRLVNLSLGKQLFARDLKSYGATAFDYWSASVTTALVMEGLAKKTRLNADDAYTIGILHALGRVLIDRVIQEKGLANPWDRQQPPEEWEREAVGFDYAEAGALLLEHWQFPEPMCEVIRQQLNPELAGDKPSMLGALQFTRRLLVLTGLDFGKDEWQFPAHDPFIQASGLSEELVTELVNKCREDYCNLLESVNLKSWESAVSAW